MGNGERLDGCRERERNPDFGSGGSDSEFESRYRYDCDCGCRSCKCGLCEEESSDDDDDVDLTNLKDPVQSLLDAATIGSLTKLRRIISAGVDANARSIGGRPVLTTVLVSPSVRRRPRRLPALAAALISAGADPGRPEPLRGMTALHAAARLVAGSVAGSGTAAGAAVHSPISSRPRCLAFRCASLRLLQLLTEASDTSAINHQDHQQRTPLHILAAHGCLSTQPYEVLFSRGADPTLRNYRGETPLLELLDRPGCGCGVPSGIEVVRLLADSTKTGVGGERALLMASRYQESGLHVAARRGSQVAVKLLLEGGADPCVVDLRGDTPLHVAAARGHCQVTQTLVNAGSSVQAVNVEGSTPLHLAVESGFVQVVEVLLTAPDCDATIATFAGLTPIELAEQAFRHNSQPQVLALLQRHLENSMEDALDTCLLDSIPSDESPESRILLESSGESSDTSSTKEKNHPLSASSALKSSFVSRFIRRSVSSSQASALCQSPRGSSEKLFSSSSNSLLKKLCISERLS